MELRHLHTILAIRDRKSFTAAAKSLGITQAAVSQHVASMEESLDVKLFDQRGRRVQITSAGEKLCGYADRILQLVATATADVQGHPLSVEGVLHIASSTVPAATVLPRILSEFRRQFPGVRPELVVSESQSAMDAVEGRSADVGFVGVKPKRKDVSAHFVAQDELVLIAAVDHPLAQRRSISLKQLAAAPLIVREPNSGSYRCLEQALQQHNVSLADMQVAMQANANDTIIAAVRAGDGVSFLSSALVADVIRSGELSVVKVSSLRLRRKLYMITLAETNGREPLRTFVDFVSASTP